MTLKSFTRVIAGLSFALIVGGVLSSPIAVQSDALKSKYDAQKAQIQTQIDSISTDLKEITKRFNDISAQKNTLIEQSREVDRQIAQLDNVILECNQAIGQLDQQLETNNKQLAALQEQKKQVIREIQKQDKVSALEVIVSSQNLSEAMNNLHNLSLLPEKADQLDAKISDTIKEIEENKRQKEECVQKSQDSRYLQKSIKDGLQSRIEAAQGQQDRDSELIKGIRDQLAQKQTEIDQTQQAYQKELAVQQEIARQKQNNYNTGGGNNGGNGGGYVVQPGQCYFEDAGSLNIPAGYFTRPTTGVMSDNFGCPESMFMDRFHDGIDIANGIGTEIYSVADGVVVRKGWDNAGFGNYLVIRHSLPSGQRVYSLYGHMNSPAIVGVGEGVSRGQTVGYMGRTGWSTGPHLHFGMISQSYDNTGGNIGCVYGSSKCYNPARFIRF